MANSTSRPRSQSAPKKALLDLDTIEREGDRPDPFTVKVGGKVITFIDSQDLDWQVLVSLANSDSPHLFFENVLKDEDFEFFVAQKVEGWRIKVLMDNYREHYGVTPDAVGN